MAKLKHFESGKRIITAINYACTHGALPDEQSINSIDTQDEYFRYQLDLVKEAAKGRLDAVTGLVTLKSPRMQITNFIRERQGLPPIKPEPEKGPNLEWIKNKSSAERVLRTIKATCDGRQSEIKADIQALESDETYSALQFERDTLKKRLERLGEDTSKDGEVKTVRDGYWNIEKQMLFLRMQAWNETRTTPYSPSEFRTLFKAFEAEITTAVTASPYNTTEEIVETALLATAKAKKQEIGLLDQPYEKKSIPHKPRFGIGKTTYEDVWRPTRGPLTLKEVTVSGGTPNTTISTSTIGAYNSAQIKALEPSAARYGELEAQQKELSKKLEEKSSAQDKADAAFKTVQAKLEAHPHTEKIRDLKELAAHYADVATSISQFLKKDEKEPKNNGAFHTYKDQSELEKKYAKLLNEKNKLEADKKELEAEKAKVQGEVAALRASLIEVENQRTRLLNEISQVDRKIGELLKEKEGIETSGVPNSVRMQEIDQEVTRLNGRKVTLQERISINTGGNKNVKEPASTLNGLIDLYTASIASKENYLGGRDDKTNKTFGDTNSLYNRITTIESKLDKDVTGGDKSLNNRIADLENDIRDNIAKSYEAYQEITQLILDFGDPKTGVHARDAEFSKPKPDKRTPFGERKTDAGAAVPLVGNIIHHLVHGTTVINLGGSALVSAIPLAINHYSEGIREPEKHELSRRELRERALRDGIVAGGGIFLTAATALSGVGLIPAALVGVASAIGFGVNNAESKSRIKKHSDYRLQVGAIEADALAENMGKVFGGLSKDKDQAEKRVIHNLKELSAKTNLQAMDNLIQASGTAEKAAAKGSEPVKPNP
jgi:predicted nuclease with TOPRIM domain